MSLPFFVPTMGTPDNSKLTGLPPAPPAFYIVGPTGVGKSEIAVALAERVEGEVVGADAFQIYSGLPILTAQPSRDQLARVQHHLVAEIPLSMSFDVAEYVRRASARITEIRTRGKVAIVVGGTGLYIRSLVRGMAELPQADPALRAELEGKPLGELNERLRALDPEGAEVLDTKNPRRVIRALEVCILTAKPFSSFRQEWNTTNTAASGILLVRDKVELRQRIDARVWEMFRDGVVEEVKRAGPMSDTARQVLGFREVERLLKGELSENDCVQAIQTKTRQYAKRQMTWFARETWLQQRELQGGADMPMDALVESVRRFAPR